MCARLCGFFSESARAQFILVVLGEVLEHGKEVAALDDHDGVRHPWGDRAAGWASRLFSLAPFLPCTDQGIPRQIGRDITKWIIPDWPRYHEMDHLKLILSVMENHHRGQ